MRDEQGAKEDPSAGVMARVPWHVVEARPLPGHLLYVRFADGVSGEVDMSTLVLSPRAGVFAALADAEIFARVGLEDGAVTWPNGVDLAPDAMYDAIKSFGRWTPRPV
ncbi:MAG TPA: DUF2442 domain-containing protein [Vicinamibacterales bacterium]|nr:DUF2442 domain-containing protein [Vicinamibacterales bacterium]